MKYSVKVQSTGNDSLFFYLPVGIVRRYSIKKGDLVNIEEDNSKLIVSVTAQSFSIPGIGDTEFNKVVYEEKSNGEIIDYEGDIFRMSDKWLVVKTDKGRSMIDVKNVVSIDDTA